MSIEADKIDTLWQDSRDSEQALTDSMKHLYWLMKSEPTDFSIDDLARCPNQTEPWTGVRNYQARNFMRRMQQGDLAFFYHSACKTPGVVGCMEIVRTAYPDPTQFNPDSMYYDPKATTHHHRWSCVDVKFINKLDPMIPLSCLRKQEALQSMLVLQTGCRLSVLPVRREEWEIINALF